MAPGPTEKLGMWGLLKIVICDLAEMDMLGDPSPPDVRNNVYNGISGNNPMVVPKVEVPRTLEGGDFRFFYWCRHYLGDALLTADEWEVAVMRDVYAGSVKFGNNICLSQVCWKRLFR